MERGKRLVNSPAGNCLRTALLDRHRKPSDELRDFAEPPVIVLSHGARKTRHAFIVTDD